MPCRGGQAMGANQAGRGAATQAASREHHDRSRGSGEMRWEGEEEETEGEVLYIVDQEGLPTSSISENTKPPPTPPRSVDARVARPVASQHATLRGPPPANCALVDTTLLPINPLLSLPQALPPTLGQDERRRCGRPRWCATVVECVAGLQNRSNPHSRPNRRSLHAHEGERGEGQPAPGCLRARHMQGTMPRSAEPVLVSRALHGIVCTH